MALGKILSKQSKMAEARDVYEKGCQATQGENPYLWQVSFFFFCPFLFAFVLLLLIAASSPFFICYTTTGRKKC